MVLDTIKLRVGDYMTPNPVSVTGETGLSEAISIMAKKRIGNLVVEDGGRPSAVFTEREILAFLVREGGIPDLKMKDVPSKRFASVSPRDLVIEAARTTIEKKKRLLVFDGKELVGIITVTDMLRGLRTTGGNPELGDTIRKKLHGCVYFDSIFKGVKIMHAKKIGSVLVSKDDKYNGIFTERDLLTRVLAKGADLQDRLEKYCSTPLITAPLGIKADDAADIMTKNSIKRLALVEKEEVRGIVTARDIVDAFRRP